MASVQLSIADPCHENWNDMLPGEKGRFCLSCQKTVVDFTQMSDRQVFDYFKNYKGSTCGQFLPAQLDREITKPKTHSIGRWKYFWQVLLPAVFAFNKGESQTLKGKVAPKVVCKADTAKPERIMMGMVAAPLHNEAPRYKLQGTIMNEKKEPIPYATIVSETGKHAVANSEGHFSMELLAGKKLTISSVGYQSKTVTYDSIVPIAVTNIEIDKTTNTVLVAAAIQLQPVLDSSQEAVVVGYGATKRRVITGGLISSVHKTTLFQKITNPVKELPQLKIFPNPIQPGQSFRVNLQVKKTGSYLLKIIDATGKTMWEEKLNITAKDQTETISGNNLQQAGVYFISVSNPVNKKDKGISGKILVQ